MADEAFGEAVWTAIAELETGEVVSYGEIAAQVGRPGAARAVGRILSGSDGQLPWWRVVTATGRLVPGSEVEHERLLAKEGVVVVNGRVQAQR